VVEASEDKSARGPGSAVGGIGDMGGTSGFLIGCQMYLPGFIRVITHSLHYIPIPVLSSP
jgi:hypothetical protein